jgi:hypothetical protein
VSAEVLHPLQAEKWGYMAGMGYRHPEGSGDLQDCKQHTLLAVVESQEEFDIDSHLDYRVVDLVACIVLVVEHLDQRLKHWTFGSSSL